MERQQLLELLIRLAYEKRRVLLSSGRIIGLVSRRALMERYHKALSS